MAANSRDRDHPPSYFVNSPFSWRAQNSAAGQTWFQSVPMVLRLFMSRRIPDPFWRCPGGQADLVQRHVRERRQVGTLVP